MDHHIHEAKQNADGRLIPPFIFALGDYAALAAAGSVYQKLHHDLQHLSGISGLSFPVAAAGFYVFQFL